MLKMSKHRLPSLKGGRKVERRNEYRAYRRAVKVVLGKNHEDEVLVPAIMRSQSGIIGV
jgi:hypothetical protein